MNRALIFLTILSLTACGSGNTSSQVRLNVQGDGMTIIGDYDPARYPSMFVQEEVAFVCGDNKMSGYSESEMGDRRGFRFKCSGPSPYGAGSGLTIGTRGASYTAG